MLLTKDERKKFIADKVARALEKTRAKYRSYPYVGWNYNEIYDAISEALDEIEEWEKRVLSGDEAGV